MSGHRYIYLLNLILRQTLCAAKRIVLVNAYPYIVSALRKFHITKLLE